MGDEPTWVPLDHETRSEPVRVYMDDMLYFGGMVRLDKGEHVVPTTTVGRALRTFWLQDHPITRTVP